jgi:hypothetical protein
MHEMIDRVADLLMSRGCGDREQCEESARAVIKVMREPTEDMFMSGGNAEPYNRSQTGRKRGGRIGDLPARSCWRLMIDRILYVHWSDPRKAPEKPAESRVGEQP